MANALQEHKEMATYVDRDESAPTKWREPEAAVDEGMARWFFEAGRQCHKAFHDDARSRHRAFQEKAFSAFRTSSS